MKRPYWKGQIRLSLVSLSVEIYPATRSYKTIPLNEIYRKTLDRVHHQNVVNNTPISRDDIIKGFEYKKGKYVTLEPAEIKEIKIPSKNILEIVQFVKASEIDPLYFDRPYFVVPKDKDDSHAFTIIREALKQTGKFGIGQFVIAGRERLCLLKPCGRGLMLDLIRYQDEIRDAENYFKDIKDVKIDEEELELAKKLIEQKSTKFHPEKFHDHYEEALQELIDSKIEHREPEYEEEKPKAEIINLMDALKKSLEQKKSVRSEEKKIRRGRK